MKLLIRTVFILMAGMMPLAIQAGDGAQRPGERYHDLDASGINDDWNKDDGKVHIAYLLDQDGRPYLISIHSEDQQVNQMIRNMIYGGGNEELMPVGEMNESVLAITFHYDHIR